MNTEPQEPQYLACEQPSTFDLLMTAAGMMGAYTYNMRGGVFCNAQTANFVLMSIAFGKGHWAQGCYYFIPICAYFAGTVLSEILPVRTRKFGLLRWDTYLAAFEIIMLFGIGFIPLSLPNQIVQVLINFIASMQYNTFRQAAGIPMATTFCTNHLRQTGIAFTHYFRKRDQGSLRKGLAHARMLLCFSAGAVLLPAICRFLEEKSIWLALIPLGIVFIKLAHADLTSEQGLLSRKPSGH